MGVSDGDIVRFPRMIEEGQGWEYVKDGVI